MIERIVLILLSLLLSASACTQNDDPQALIKNLHHENKKVRQEAMHRLSQMGDDAIPYMVQAIEHCAYPEDWEPEAEVLLKLGDKAVPQLCGLAAEGELDAQLRAIEVLRRMRARSAEKPLIHMLNHESKTIRAAAVNALGYLGSSASVDALVEQLASGSPQIIEEAVVSLARIGDTRAAPAVETLLTGENKDIKLIALKALRQLGTARTLQTIQQFIEREHHRQLRQEAQLTYEHLQQRVQ